MAEFAEWEMKAGGPDPHMKVAGHMVKDAKDEDVVWMGGLYAGLYNVPTAEVLYLIWPWQRVLDEGTPSADWIQEHWRGLSFRRERRAVRTPRKLALYLEAYAIWAKSLKSLPVSRTQPAEDNYEILWRSLEDEVIFMGRYSSFKLLEFLRRYAEFPIELPDIRPRGGWSPRLTLSYLYPEFASILNGGDHARNIRHVNEVAEDGRRFFASKYGIEVDRYTFEVILCDYRQSYDGERQYPGRSQDSELEYHQKISPYWGNNYHTKMFEARAELFPHACLGEIDEKWSHVRKELGTTLRQFNYTWSDLKYDYLKSRENLANPVRVP